MLSDYTGGPASNLGYVVQFAKIYVDMVIIQTTMLRHERKLNRLRIKAKARELPDKRLHISGSYYVH